MATQPPHGNPVPKLSRSTIFPLLGNRKNLRAKGHLLPIFATIILGVLVFFTFIETFPALGPYTNAEMNSVWQITWLIGLYIAFIVNYYVYEFCGHARPWWLIVALVALMMWLAQSTFFFKVWSPLFYTIIPGDSWQKSPSLFVKFFGWMCTGFCEEGFKALPLLALAVVAWRGKGKLAKRIGLFEPLDGIIFGVASGSGFFLAETLTNYVPGEMIKVLMPYVQAQGAQGVTAGAGEAAYHGLALLLGRGIPEFAGHSAYSGVFGYFIGLAVLRSFMWVRLLLLGWLSAAFLHAMWDFSGPLVNPQGNAGLIVFILVQIAIALLAYYFLAAAVIKGRQISPTRAFNFATVLRPSELQPPPPVAPAPPAAAPAAPAPATVTLPAAPPSLVLAIGPVRRELVPGMQLEAQLFGAAGAELGPGSVARVEADPNDPQAWGLANMTARAWNVTLPTGKVIELAAGKAVRLSPGLAIDFGGITGTVEAA